MKQTPNLRELYTIYKEVPESFLGDTDVNKYFYHQILDIALIDNGIDGVSKGSNKKVFSFKLFRFCNLKNQQRFILEGEVSLSSKKLAALLNTLRQFLKQYDKTVKSPALHPLPKPKQEIGFSLFRDELFAQKIQDCREHCIRQIRLSFRFELNKQCCFSIKKFQTVGERNDLREIINLRHCDVHNLYKSRYYNASDCGIFDSNSDIWPKSSCSGTLPRSKFSATHRRCDLSK